MDKSTVDIGYSDIFIGYSDIFIGYSDIFIGYSDIFIGYSDIFILHHLKHVFFSILCLLVTQMVVVKIFPHFSSPSSTSEAKVSCS